MKKKDAPTMQRTALQTQLGLKNIFFWHEIPETHTNKLNRRRSNDRLLDRITVYYSLCVRPSTKIALIVRRSATHALPWFHVVEPSIAPSAFRTSWKNIVIEIARSDTHIVTRNLAGLLGVFRLRSPITCMKKNEMQIWNQTFLNV
jgi:hypothetical protein